MLSLDFAASDGSLAPIAEQASPFSSSNRQHRPSNTILKTSHSHSRLEGLRPPAIEVPSSPTFRLTPPGPLVLAMPADGGAGAGVKQSRQSLTQELSLMVPAASGGQQAPAPVVAASVAHAAGDKQGGVMAVPPREPHAAGPARSSDAGPAGCPVPYASPGSPQSLEALPSSVRLPYLTLVQDSSAAGLATRESVREGPLSSTRVLEQRLGFDTEAVTEQTSEDVEP